MPSSSRGAGSDISQQDAILLLHKLSTERTNVVASLRTSSKLSSSVLGKVKLAEQDGSFWVIDDTGEIPQAISFDLSLAVRRTYGDGRPASEGIPVNWRFSSALCFEFPEGERLCLFALADDES